MCNPDDLSYNSREFYDKMLITAFGIGGFFAGGNCWGTFIICRCCAKASLSMNHHALLGLIKVKRSLISFKAFRD